MPLLLMMVLACYKNTVLLGPPAGGQVYETRKAFVVWGALPHQYIDMDAVCPNGVARIEEQQNFLDGTIACFTLGFVRTVSVKISCADGTAYRFMGNPTLGSGYLLPEEG